jgi:hypothetical protein
LSETLRLPLTGVEEMFGQGQEWNGGGFLLVLVADDVMFTCD